MVIDDTTGWPDPAVTGPFYFQVSRPYPEIADSATGNGRKNLFLCTARSGNTLTVSRYTGGLNSVYSASAESYAAGSYAGSEGGTYIRPFSALPAGENGRAVNDRAAGGAVPIRSRSASTPLYGVPRDVSQWLYGYYGHPTNQAIWGNPAGQSGASPWVPWIGGTTYTPRGGTPGTKENPWDGTEFWLQFRVKVDKRFWGRHQHPVSLLGPIPAGSGADVASPYWGRKFWSVQSEISVVNQIVAGISPSARYSLPTTNETPFSLSTYKSQQTVGTSDWTSYGTRTHPSRQMNSLWDVAPYYAYCQPTYPNGSQAFLPSAGVGGTPDKSSMWEWKDNEWITFLLHVVPGNSGVPNTTIECWFARTEDINYDGTYTKLMSVTDARVVYSGQGDYDYPDGYFTSSSVTTMNTLPGYQAFYIFGYYNIHGQGADAPPPIRSYWTRTAQIIFSRNTIPAPAVEVPTWRRAMAVRTWAAIGGLPSAVNPANDAAINPNGAGNTPPWIGAQSGFGFTNIMNAWNGGAFNVRSDELWVTGGGHGDYRGNEIIVLDLWSDNPQWRLERKPTGAIGNTGNLADGLEATSVFFDGRPRSNHTYGGLCFADDDFWMVPGAPSDSGVIGSAGAPGFRYRGGDWDLKTSSWVGSNIDQNAGGGLVFVPTQNALYFCPRTNSAQMLRRLDLGTFQGSDTVSVFGGSAYSMCVYVDVYDILVVLNDGYVGGFGVYDFGRTAGTSIFRPGLSGVSEAKPAYAYSNGDFYPNGVWVPELGAIACWHGGTSIRLLTPPATNQTTSAWTWSTLTALGGATPTNPQGNGTWGRFFYSQRLKVLGVVNAVNQQTYVFSVV